MFASTLEGHSASYRVYQGFKLNLGESSEMIIFLSLETNFNLGNNFWGGSLITLN